MSAPPHHAPDQPDRVDIQPGAWKKTSVGIQTAISPLQSVLVGLTCWNLGSHVCMVDVQRYLLSVNMNQLWWGGAKAGAVPRELFYDCVEKERMKVPGVNHPIHHMKVGRDTEPVILRPHVQLQTVQTAKYESLCASAPIYLFMRVQVLFRVVPEDVAVGPGELAAWLYLGSHNLSKSAVRHMPGSHQPFYTSLRCCTLENTSRQEARFPQWVAISHPCLTAHSVFLSNDLL